MRILGYTRYAFTGDNGNPVSGVTFYYAYPINDKHGHGYRNGKHFSLPADKIPELIPFDTFDDFVGCDVELYYNQWGKVSKIDILGVM